VHIASQGAAYYESARVVADCSSDVYVLWLR